MQVPKAGRYPRRRIVTQPTYQWSVTYVIVGFLVGSMGLSLVLVFSAVASALRALDVGDEMLLAAVFSRVTWLLSIELLVLVPLFVWVGLWITHKVVGPFGRIKAALDQIGRGNYTVRLHLRKGDVLMDLAEGINRLADSMGRR
jgi:nitrate/nitrite-specific signal transduction histidine kinase